MSYERFDSFRNAAEAGRRDGDRRRLRPDATPTPRQRRWLRTGLAVALLASVAVLWAVSGAERRAVAEVRPVDRIEPESDRLVIHWTGHECDSVNPHRTEVVETGEQVAVTLYVETPPDCEAWEYVQHRAELPLERPVGDRTVIDAGCRFPAFARDERCADASR